MNYFNEKIIDLLKNQVLNLSVDQIKEIYQVFDNGGIKEIENQDVHQVFQDFLNQHEVVKKQFDLPFFIDNKKKKNRNNYFEFTIHGYFVPKAS